MTTEQVKKELNDINNKLSIIKALEIKIDNRRSLLDIKTISFGDEVSGKSAITEIDLIYQVSKLEKQKLNLQYEIDLLFCFIESLNDNEKRIILSRYKEKLTLSEVAELVSYDVGHVKRLITSSLEKITEMYSKIEMSQK